MSGVTSRPEGHHIVFFSGGAGSYAAAKRAIDKAESRSAVKLLFTDTKIEDPTLYSFIESASARLEVELIKIADGRTPWEVFRDVRFLGNTRIDPCSKILKRDLAAKWIKDHYTPSNVTLYFGLDWLEPHRVERVTERWKPFKVVCPLSDPPYLSKKQLIDQVSADGLPKQRLYEMGFPHNNCGGFCIKAGQKHFKHLLEKMPERYEHHEKQEQELRDYLKKNVAILRDRRGGTTTPLTLKQLRERNIKDVDPYDWGGCGCFLG